MTHRKKQALERADLSGFKVAAEVQQLS